MDDWTAFRYLSLPPDRNWKDHEVIYKHWLPKQHTSLGKEKDYSEFDTLIHATSISNAEKIFENGGLKQQVVADTSIINPAITFYRYDNVKMEVEFKNCHPMVGTEVVWYGPYKRENLRTSEPKIRRYGNAVFSMKTLHGLEGIISQPDDFNFYFVEIVDYLIQSACRILITKKEYPELSKYDPYQKGGPWYINENGKHFHLTEIQNASGKYVPNTLEFMREEEESFRSMWLANHDVSYKPCSHENLRKGVSISNNDCRGRLKLALGLLAYKMKYKSNFVLQQWCFLDGEKDILDIVNYKVKQNINWYTEGIHEGKRSRVEYDGPDPGKYIWLKHQLHDDCCESFCIEVLEWLKPQIDMNVFNMKKFIEFLLILNIDKLSLFSVDVDIKWIPMFFRYILPRRLPIFLETLVGMIQENLLHTYSGHSPDYKEVTGMPAWQNYFSRFDFESTHRLKNEEVNHYWLPADCTKFGNEKEYQEFDTLTYTTSLANAYEIFEGGQLTPSVVSVNSVVSEEYSEELGQRRHPLADVKLMSYRTGSRNRMKEGHFSDHPDGNVIFAMKRLNDHGGIVNWKCGKNFHYYFVEIVENGDTCSCRILVTKRVYPQLCSYDPYRKGGPWYVENGKHYCLMKIENLRGQWVSNEVEFYREEYNNENALASWLTNHEILYNRDKNEGNGDDMLNLALGLLACKIAQPENQVLQLWFLVGGTGDIYKALKELHRNTLEELSECGKEIDKPCPDHFTKHIAEILSKCNFGQNGEEIFHLYEEMSKQMDFGNIDMTNFVQGILKFYRKHFFLQEMELQTVYKKLLSLVNSECSSLFVEELEQELQDNALHRIHRKVRTRQNWTDFSYYIKHPGSSKNKGSVYVRHWLPKDYKDLLPEDSATSDMTCYYKEFDVLMKSPDEKSYRKCESGDLKPVLHKISGPSVANVRNELFNHSFERIGTGYAHPLNHADVYCYMADSFENVKSESKRKEKYGEDTFRMNYLWGNEGIYRRDNEFNHYLIEVIDFPDESICRVLATYGNTYPGLLKIDTITDRYLSMIRNHEGRKVKNTVEILREVRNIGWQYENWKVNHIVLRKDV